MKSYNNILFNLLAILVLIGVTNSVSAAEVTTNSPSTLPQNIIVKFKTNQTPDQITARIKKEKELSETNFFYKIKYSVVKFFQKVNPDEKMIAQFKSISGIKSTPLFNSYYLISTPNYFTLTKTITPLAQLSNVEFVIPDSYVSVQAITPTKTVEPTKTVSKKITGKSSLTIAVVDTGVNYITSLQSSLLVGHNILDPKKKQYDDNNHGTAIAEVLVTQLQDVDAQVLPIKVFDKSGVTPLSSILKGLAYLSELEKSPARIVNLSFAGPRLITVADKKYDICQAYADLAKNFENTVFVAAAGNDNEEAKPNKRYDGVAPASCDPFISVGAEQEDGKKAKSSNYSASDIYAPGTSEKFSGTSVAAAYISGTLATLLHENPKLHAAQITALLSNYNKAGDSKKAITEITVDKLIADVKSLPDPTQTPAPARSIGGSTNITIIVTNTPEPTKKITSVPSVTLSPTKTPTVGIPSLTPTKTPPTPTIKPSNTPPAPTPTRTPTPTNVPPSPPPRPPTSTPVPPPTSTPIPPTAAPPTPVPATPTNAPPTSTPITCYETLEQCENICRGRCEYRDTLCDPRNDRLFACY